MKRAKVYDAPHKGLRYALAQLLTQAGKTNYSNHQEVEVLYHLGKDIFQILTIHAEDENEIMLKALEERYPGGAHHDIEDHEKLDSFQHRLEDLLETIYQQSKEGKDVTEEGDEFYLAFSEFQGLYLAHTAEEERVTQPLFWQHFTDEELAANRGKIIGNIAPPILLIWFRFIIPAQNHFERVGFLSGFKQNAPEPFYQQVMQMLKGELQAQDFEALQFALA